MVEEAPVPEVVVEETVTVCTGFAVPAVLETPDGMLELEIEELD